MTEREELADALEAADLSLKFLVLLLFGILLSLYALLIQRQQLRDTLAGGRDSGCPSPLPFQRSASAITVGALGFFFSLALQTWQGACAKGRPQVTRLARVNLAASTLVLAAALLRLWTLLESGALGESAPAEEIEDQPA